jgi:tRNA (adenine57-N1/adenine58-N1)-methyltransferase
MLARPIRERRHEIQEGDLVIVYERHDRMKALVVKPGELLQNRYGVFRHSDWIGKPFGCRVSGKSGGFVHLLAPTPELWTCVLSHRTQILYVADISFVVSYLELCPGKVVLESGTGSGSLTTSLARAVAPSGHVYTFDFHEERAASARLVPLDYIHVRVFLRLFARTNSMLKWC